VGVADLQRPNGPTDDADSAQRLVEQCLDTMERMNGVFSEAE
jgi:hypothetical protein